MFTSLSAYRLRETSSVLAKISSAGREFVVLRSKTLKPVTQYYIVSADWKRKALTAQIEPLAHVNVTKTGKTILKTWQPEKFEFERTKQSFLQEFQSLLH